MIFCYDRLNRLINRRLQFSKPVGANCVIRLCEKLKYLLNKILTYCWWAIRVMFLGLPHIKRDRGQPAWVTIEGNWKLLAWKRGYGGFQTAKRCHVEESELTLVLVLKTRRSTEKEKVKLVSVNNRKHSQWRGAQQLKGLLPWAMEHLLLKINK